MGYCKRASVILNAYRSLASKYSRSYGACDATGSLSVIRSEFPSSTVSHSGVLPSLSRRFGSLGRVSDPAEFSPPSLLYNSRISLSSASLNNSRRFYYVDRYSVHHFKPRGTKKWFREPRAVFVMVIIVSGVGITVYFGNSETIPYTKRTHFVLLSKSLERQIGEAQFEQLKRNFKGNVLPAIHPDSIRVRLIAKDIIEALLRGIKHQNEWSGLEYGGETFTSSDASHKGRQDVPVQLREEEKLEGRWSREDEILDDSWVEHSRRKAIKRGSQSMTQHLQNLNWEVIVVRNPMVNAFCLPGGKIVVFTGLLDHFRADAEIATVIGHEVGHCIARHAAEGITKNMWVALIQLVLLQIISLPDLVNAASNLILRLPFSRRMEIEADYIGLLLMAAAGYDPRVAPRVYEKLGKVGGDSPLRDYLSTHPSGKTRAKLLAHAKVMEEAISMYSEALSGRGVQGFL